jgi:hypothetical protein
MRIVLSRHYIRALVVALPWVAAAQALGGELQITVTNNQPAGGFAISPVWVGVHDGTFKTFDPGAQASAAIQAVAELADTSKITASFAGHGAQTTVGGMPYVPGASVTSTLNVADPSTNRYLSYAAMVVPSNDFFVGNANPTAFQLFDASGHFLGPKTIQIFGANVWDAGTEVNNIAFGAAFIVGDNITDHVDENSTIMMVFGGGTDFSGYLGSINGKPTPAGYDISHLISSGDLIATIQINSVPEPSAAILLGLGVSGVLIAARGRKPRA